MMWQILDNKVNIVVRALSAKIRRKGTSYAHTTRPCPCLRKFTSELIQYHLQHMRREIHVKKHVPARDGILKVVHLVARVYRGPSACHTFTFHGR
jgi:hypothetical protein